MQHDGGYKLAMNSTLPSTMGTTSTCGTATKEVSDGNNHNRAEIPDRKEFEAIYGNVENITRMIWE